jgi:ferredoxin-thioredoxin reductase catalytic subunit
MSWYERLKKNAERNAEKNLMSLCPDSEQLDSLIKGLVENRERYGYPSCPCRVSSGILENDKDIICPCDYRTPDVEEYGMCYCALYVHKDVHEGKSPLEPIPERRPYEKQLGSLGFE